MHEETPTPLGRHRRRTSKARRRLVQAQWGYNKGRRKGGAGQPVVVQRLKAEASKEVRMQEAGASYEGGWCRRSGATTRGAGREGRGSPWWCRGLKLKLRKRYV
ncbi:unnamed protein product [Closterium sp. NIES-53]